MANVHDVKLDICSQADQMIGKISLRLEFSNDDIQSHQKYGLYTALIIDHGSGVDDVMTSAHSLYMDDSDPEDDMTWVDTRMIQPIKRNIIHLNIEKDLCGDPQNNYRAVVYLIPEVRTSFAWSGQQKKLVV